MNYLRRHIIQLLPLLVLCVSALAPVAAHAGFDPNRIIDDTVFTNKSSMTPSDIQTFLNGKVATCDTNHPKDSTNSASDNPPWTCLKDFNEGGRSSAQIIYDAAQLYTINPRVLIVNLQKEQGLVTDDWPGQSKYRAAMGFACPDTAACDPAYAGFTNQVNQAARYFRNFYDQNPNWFMPVREGQAYVRYSPNSSCGGSTLNVNKATSALYSYTPYQPNQAALDHLYDGGLGDGCSAYGNRNFWRYYTNWFGSTLGYDYAFISATNPPAVMQPGQTVDVTVVLRNTGGKTWWDEINATYAWNKDPDGGGAPTPMRLFTTQPNDHANPFGGGAGWVGQSRMTMLSGKANQGDPATFKFTYTAPTVPGTYTDHFAPTAENAYKLRDSGMAFTVTVPKAYRYSFVSATNPPSTMLAGQHATATVILKNTGNTTWYNEAGAVDPANRDSFGGGAPTPMRLFTTRPTDHANPFGGGAGWVGQSRMTMQTASVPPGQDGTFSFDYAAPSRSGSYTDYFAPTMENVAKLNDVGMAFTVNVPPVYEYEFVSATNPPSNMTPGQTATATVVLKNTGSATWHNEAGAVDPANRDSSGGGAPTPFRLFTTRATDHANPFGGGAGWVAQNRMTMQTASVPTGGNATFTFEYKAPTIPGTYVEYFAPTMENAIKLRDVGMAFGVTVR